MISQQYRHGKRRMLGTSLYIIDSLYIYSTIFIIYNQNYCMQGLFLFYLLHSGTCGYPSDNRPLNYILKFSLLNLLI